MKRTARENAGRYPLGETRKFIGQDLRNPLHGMSKSHALLIQDLDVDDNKNLTSRAKFLATVSDLYPSNWGYLADADGYSKITYLDGIECEGTLILLAKIETPSPVVGKNARFAFVAATNGGSCSFVRHLNTSDIAFGQWSSWAYSNFKFQNSQFTTNGGRVYWFGDIGGWVPINPAYGISSALETPNIVFQRTQEGGSEWFFREMGMPTNWGLVDGLGLGVQDTSASLAQSKGIRCLYGEIICKKNGVVLSSSGPVLLAKYASYYMDGTTTNWVGVKIALTPEALVPQHSWTHFRLWVSKPLYSSETPDVEGGLETLSYFVGEFPRSQFEFVSFVAGVSGPDIPAHLKLKTSASNPAIYNFIPTSGRDLWMVGEKAFTDGTPPSYNENHIGLQAFPRGRFGTYVNGRLVMAPALTSQILSKVPTPEEGVFIGYGADNVGYLCEQTSLLLYKKVMAGQGGMLQALTEWGGNLWAFKAGAVGILDGLAIGIRDFSVIDRDNGVQHSSHIWPTSVGVLAYCSDDRLRVSTGSEFRESLSGVDLSIGVPYGFTVSGTTKSRRLTWSYRGGRVLVKQGVDSSGQNVSPCYALHLRNFGGWTKYTLGESPDPFAFLVNNQNTPTVNAVVGSPVLAPASKYLWVESPPLDSRDLADTSDRYQGWRIITSPWGTDSGRDYIELTHASLVARIGTSADPLRFGVFTNTRASANTLLGASDSSIHMGELGDITPMATNLWGAGFWSTNAMPSWAPPDDIDPDHSNMESVEYTYYPQPLTPNRSRVYAQKIGVSLHGDGVVQIHDIRLVGFQTQNTRRGTPRPTQVSWDNLTGLANGAGSSPSDIVNLEINKGNYQ